MRRLIINADDLGLTEGVNRGIFDCIRSGIVTSATLMANARAVHGAIRTCLSADKKVSFGCHVVLVDGQPLCPSDQVRSLLAAGSSHGFPRGFGNIAVATCTGRSKSIEVEREIEAQLRALLDSGLQLSHVDSHKHVHLLPGILRPLLRAARACGIRAVRNPFAPMKPLALAHLTRRPYLWKRYSEVKVLRSLAAKFRSHVEEAGMITTDGTFGIVATGSLDLPLFEAIVGSVPEGTWELCCHPGYNDADLDVVTTRLRESRVREVEVFMSEAARDILEERGVELISYWDLQ